jgi:hypothetical protein
MIKKYYQILNIYLVATLSDIHISAKVSENLKARTAGPQKQPLPGNGCVTHNNGITVGSSVFCVVNFLFLFVYILSLLTDHGGL